ncbi:MAG: AAA family ATPase [Intestinimonas sp.]|nr:AAA family ATPase [Intestinimonas sp.]
MKEFMTAAAMHKQYDEGVSAFRRTIANPAMRQKFNQDVDEFMRQCALGVWQSDGGGVTPTHVEYYNGIYCRGNLTPSALYWELCTAVSEYPGFQPPDFFRKMREYDQAYHQDTARRFVDLMTLMLLLFAAADGALSDREAGFVNACADALTSLCDRDGLPGEKARLDAEDFVTRKNGEKPAADPAPQAGAPSAVDASGHEVPPRENLDDLLAELDGLCGLKKVKEDVRSLINLVKVRRLRQEQGLPVPPLSLHLVFMGNPGTGKTTVARLLARVYHAIGVLSKGQLVEVDRSGLVAGFVGQTAIKTGEVIQKALGGVLFIDEAYALVNQENANDFGKEAIEVLLKGMEDHRDDLIVIVAGYTELMGRFISSNPGLESRFNKYFFFEDYDGEQLMEIFRSMCVKNGYTLAEAAQTYAADAFRDMYKERDENFGNARDVRNVFERTVARQANRVAALDAPTREQLMELTISDLRGEEEQENTEQQADKQSPEDEAAENSSEENLD